MRTGTSTAAHPSKKILWDNLVPNRLCALTSPAKIISLRFAHSEARGPVGPRPHCGPFHVCRRPPLPRPPALGSPLSSPIWRRGGGQRSSERARDTGATVGGHTSQNSHALTTPHAAPTKQQQCCAPQSRSAPARPRAACRPTCTPAAAPRATTDSARERTSPIYCPLRKRWICGWQRHALPRRRHGLERPRRLIRAAERHGAPHAARGGRLDEADGRDDA